MRVRVLNIVLSAVVGATGAVGVFATKSHAAEARSCVVLLHGLSRTENSMAKLGRVLAARDYQVVNEQYPSRDAEISKLSEIAINHAREACGEDDAPHFVTHSMGGILVRDYYLRHDEAPRPKAVVMLAPPNQGSVIIDHPAYPYTGGYWFGAAAKELSAKPDSFVNQLGGVDYPVGIIAGNKTVNPYFSKIIPGDDDGAVAVSATWVDGAADWIVLPATHSFIMNNAQVIDQVGQFLENGEFAK